MYKDSCFNNYSKKKIILTLIEKDNVCRSCVIKVYHMLAGGPLLFAYMIIIPFGICVCGSQSNKQSYDAQ